MTLEKARRIARLALWLAIFANIVTLLYFGDFSSGLWVVIVAMLFGAWLCVPNLMLFCLAKYMATPILVLAPSIINFILILFNGIAYFEGVPSDAQGALLFIFLPLWEVIAIIMLGFVFIALNKWSMKKHAK
jgi:hypothetical protein